MITKEQALNGREFHYNHVGGTGKCTKWRRNGQNKTWKTRPDEFRIPIKYGLRDYQYLTQSDLENFHLASECTNQTGN